MLGLNSTASPFSLVVNGSPFVAEPPTDCSGPFQLGTSPLRLYEGQRSELTEDIQEESRYFTPAPLRAAASPWDWVPGRSWWLPEGAAAELPVFSPAGMLAARWLHGEWSVQPAQDEVSL